MRRLITAALAVGLLTASTGLSAALPATSASAATDTTPIVVGGDGDLSISQGVIQGFEAGIYRFNKAGGLDGRKIKWVGFLDDGFSAQTSLTNAQQLVDNKGVFAVAPLVGQAAGGATGTFLQNAKIPFVGWSTNAAFEVAPKWGFGINGNQGNPEVQGAGGMLQTIQAQGAQKDPAKVKMALIGNDVTGAIVANNALAGVAKRVGITVTYAKAPVPALGTTNYAPYAEALIASGANTVYEVLGASDSVGLAAALKSAGFKGMIINGVTYYPGTLNSQPSEKAALQGVYVENEFPANENNTPATKQASKDLVSIGQQPGLSSGTSAGYWSAIVLEQMLRSTLARVGSISKVTPAAVQQTVAGGTSWVYTDPIAGGIGQETFPAAESIPTGCGTLLKTVGSTFKQIEPYKCYYALNITTGQKLDPQTGKPIK
jgi:hypothetical protein